MKKLLINSIILLAIATISSCSTANYEYKYTRGVCEDSCNYYYLDLVDYDSKVGCLCKSVRTKKHKWD